MALNPWMSANLSPDTILQRDLNEGDTIFLEEKDDNVDMTVEIVGVPETVVIVLPQEVEHLQCLARKGLKYICDYLLLFQSDDRYYAIFVELKKTLTDEDKPREQLRRTLPLLRYILSVFNVDSGSMLSESKFIMNYFLFGQQPNPNWDKQRVNVSRASLFQSETYERMKIRTSLASAVSFKVLVKS